MQNTLIGALSTMVTLQRWNALPRIETWVEAENAAYVAHLTYAMGKKLELPQEELRDVLFRALLKSLSKHHLSDIPFQTRDEIKLIDPNLWRWAVGDAAKTISSLFPKSIQAFVGENLNPTPTTKESRGEKLLEFVQLNAALEECSVNKKVFSSYYEPIEESFKEKIAYLRVDPEWQKAYHELKEYFSQIRKLKYLRRWNRVNRAIETSVLCHTYIVAVLTLVFSMITTAERAVVPQSEAAKAKRGAEEGPRVFAHDEDFVYAAVVRALFHDVPEGVTGDIIQPVKTILEGKRPGIIKEVEEKMVGALAKDAGVWIEADKKRFRLFEDLDGSEVYTIDSICKECDQLGLLLECILEGYAGKMVGEVANAYWTYLQRLLTTEWPAIR